MKYYAGLDVSLDETAVCIVDEDGIVIREGKVSRATDPPAKPHLANCARCGARNRRDGADLTR
jgi:hypothetical protein